MPREQINTPARRTITMPTGTNGLKPGEYGLHFASDGDQLAEGQHWEDTATVFVGWHREADRGLPLQDEGCLQLHTTVAVEEVLRAADEIRRCQDNPDVPGHASWTFSTVMLSRQEAQKAIRFIRRARDAAYGADE